MTRRLFASALLATSALVGLGRPAAADDPQFQSPALKALQVKVNGALQANTMVSALAAQSAAVRTALGLGTAATKNVGTTTGTVADGSVDPIARGAVQASGGDASGTVVLGRTLAARASDVVNVKDAPFNAKLDGSTNDTAALNAARTATPGYGTILIPPGGINFFSTPTGGSPSPVLWQMSGNTYGSGSTLVNDMGTDVVETFNGAKYFSQAHTKPDSGPLVSISRTVDHTGGTPGNVMATLSVSTKIPAAAAAINNYPWGILSQIDSWAQKGSEPVGILSYAYRHQPGSQLWNQNHNVADMTDGPSSVNGALINTEYDMSVNGLDDSGSAVDNIPAGAGTRVIEDLICNQYNPSGSLAVCGWGSRVGMRFAQGYYHRGYSMNGAWDTAGFDASLGKSMSGAPAFRMASNMVFDFDGATTHTIGYNSGTGAGLVYKRVTNGTTVTNFQSLDTGEFDVGSTVAMNANGISLAVVGANTVGLDFSTATLSGNAIRLKSGQEVAYEATGTFKTGLYNGCGIGWKSGSTILACLNSTSNGGALSVTGAIQHSVSPGLTAAGTTQATAFALTRDISAFTTVASGSGALLQANIGQRQEVFNRGANALLVYPPSGAQIEATGSNAAVTLAVGGHATFECVTATQCYQAP